EKLVEFLENFKKEINEGKIKIDEEQIEIPEGDMDIEYGFKIEDGQKEIEIEIKWK
ncbi:MAG: amphi-Trp domain-containing protein, partial [Minisyncoccales bacterium]